MRRLKFWRYKWIGRTWRWVSDGDTARSLYGMLPEGLRSWINQNTWTAFIAGGVGAAAWVLSVVSELSPIYTFLAVAGALTMLAVFAAALVSVVRGGRPVIINNVVDVQGAGSNLEAAAAVVPAVITWARLPWKVKRGKAIPHCNEHPDVPLLFDTGGNKRADIPRPMYPHSTKIRCFCIEGEAGHYVLFDGKSVITAAELQESALAADHKLMIEFRRLNPS